MAYDSRQEAGRHIIYDAFAWAVPLSVRLDLQTQPQR